MESSWRWAVGEMESQAMETAGTGNFLVDHHYSKCGVTWELGREIAGPCAMPAKSDSVGMEPSSLA